MLSNVVNYSMNCCRLSWPVVDCRSPGRRLTTDCGSSAAAVVPVAGRRWQLSGAATTGNYLGLTDEKQLLSSLRQGSGSQDRNNMYSVQEQGEQE